MCWYYKNTEYPLFFFSQMNTEIQNTEPLSTRFLLVVYFPFIAFPSTVQIWWLINALFILVSFFKQYWQDPGWTDIHFSPTKDVLTAELLGLRIISAKPFKKTLETEIFAILTRHTNVPQKSCYLYNPNEMHDNII